MRRSRRNKVKLGLIDKLKSRKRLFESFTGSLF